MEQEELNPDGKIQQEKAKKNLVYVGILSVIMFFAGLTSAYIVSMGDAFWLSSSMPKAFWISTTIILISSAVLHYALYAVKNGNYSGLKIGVSLTFILGLAFIYFQFQGYEQLSEKGVRVNQEFFVDEGYYGYNEDMRIGYFDMKYKDDFITTDGYDFSWKGKPLTPDVNERFRDYMMQFADQKYTMWDAMTSKDLKENEFTKVGSTYKVKEDPDFTLYYRKEPTFIKDGVLYKNDTTKFQMTDRLRLRNLANNIRDERGDFYVKGKMGKDFKVQFRPKYIITADGKRISNKKEGKYYELEYIDRRLKYKGMDGYLTENDLRNAMETADTSSSYLWIITFAHLLHIIVTMFYLLRVVIRSFTGRITQDNYIGLKTGAIFWHFLGALWIYLLLFLLFIH